MSPYHKGRLVLLLVEDSFGDAEYITDLLATARWRSDEVIHVTTLADAVSRLSSLDPDAVLLDLRLPDGAGVDCVERIRGAKQDVPIVVLTGLDDHQLALVCIGAGAQDYLPKQELRPHMLLRAIAYAMARVGEASERKRADDLQKLLATIVETSPDAIISTTVDGVITTWNRGAEQTFGYTDGEVLGRPLSEVVRAPDEAGAVDQERRMAALRDDEGAKVSREVVRLRKDEAPLTLSVVTSALRDPSGRITGLAAICRDVTEDKRRDDALRHTNEQLAARERQLRALTGRLIAVREEERTRISREVHDELGQLLTGLKMDLRWIGRRVAPTSDADAVAAISHRIAMGEALVDSTIATVQRIAVELRPSALDALGLPAAIRDEARRFEERTGVAMSVRVDESVQPSRDVGTALFRILQELLTNVARHAGASSLWILLEQDRERWTLRVEDDGVGVDAAAEIGPSSLGLLGIRERTESLGGEFSLGRRDRERGTVATVRVPRAGGDGDAERIDRG